MSNPFVSHPATATLLSWLLLGAAVVAGLVAKGPES